MSRDAGRDESGPGVLFFESAAEFRAWLEAHHDTAAEVLAGFHKKATGRPSMTWPESVDQALCFGWIDGLRRSLGPEAYAIRFTPRRAGSTWSAVNVARAEELTRLGAMHPAGIRVFEARDAAKSRLYSYERAAARLEPDEEARLESDAAARAFWEAQPPSYRQAALWWLVSARQRATRERRLATLIADSAAGRRIAPLRQRRGG